VKEKRRGRGGEVSERMTRERRSSSKQGKGETHLVG